MFRVSNMATKHVVSYANACRLDLDLELKLRAIGHPLEIGGETGVCARARQMYKLPRDSDSSPD